MFRLNSSISQAIRQLARQRIQKPAEASPGAGRIVAECPKG